MSVCLFVLVANADKRNVYDISLHVLSHLMHLRNSANVRSKSSQIAFSLYTYGYRCTCIHLVDWVSVRFRIFVSVSVSISAVACVCVYIFLLFVSTSRHIDAHRHSNRHTHTRSLWHNTSALVYSHSHETFVNWQVATLAVLIKCLRFGFFLFDCVQYKIYIFFRLYVNACWWSR